ncbi:MAG: S-layer homology domain-containing protein [Clostridiales bacterium]|nr:S-layer homology domain-containing protein [Clostridiales bacterium]
MKRKGILAFLLALALVFSLMPAAFAASEEAIDAADKLHALGLFQGKGTNEDGTPNYDLDAAPTRNEAVTMLVRLLGKEEEAKAGTWDLPFTDLSEWARPYVGYAYANGLTKGTGETTFGGGSLITATQYLTFILRALGYDSSTDFKWNAAWELSDALGITQGEYNADSAFIRGDVALISVSALQAALKDGSQTLAEKLISEGVFTEEQYKDAFGEEQEPEPEEPIISIPDEPGPDVSPTVLFLTKDTKILDGDENVIMILPAFTACLVDIPKNSINFHYQLEDITDGKTRVVEEAWGGFEGNARAASPLCLGLWSEELLQMEHRYRLKIEYEDLQFEIMGKECVYEFEYPVGSIGSAAPVPEGIHWNEKGLPSWTVEEEPSDPYYFIYVEIDNQLKRERKQHFVSGSAFMLYPDSSEQYLIEKMEEIKALGGEGAVYRFRMKSFSIKIHNRNHSLWSEWSEWSPLT